MCFTALVINKFDIPCYLAFTYGMTLFFNNDSYLYLSSSTLIHINICLYLMVELCIRYFEDLSTNFLFRHAYDINTMRRYEDLQGREQ